MTALAGHRVMVVEDEALIAMDLETLLTDAGCTVLGPVRRVADALALIACRAPDLALLDINLGDELVFPVADDLSARAIPFVFVSGHCHDALPPAHAARPLVSKPFRPDQLRRALAAAIGG